MDCDLKTFTKELMGKYGFTLSDWIYLQHVKTKEEMIQELFDLRDQIYEKEKELKKVTQNI